MSSGNSGNSSTVVSICGLTGIQVQLDLKSNGKGSNAKKAPAGRSRASVSAAGGRLLAGQLGRGRVLR
ncbi:hypothetical protein E2562_027020 [Oryza meyeriana var. granulata]|uniref:Uncharacterized protein n=1 Tax=Oryza meyeriana var. granulata TaxID=110450 RepID=A0A6G1C7M4_9ORYZ|nr:hypothetical protein E2562_027020 [Oryza meyeriana var. granulata]